MGFAALNPSYIAVGRAPRKPVPRPKEPIG
jgi:hypothetical protein